MNRWLRSADYDATQNDLFGSRNDFQGAIVIADNVAVVPDHMFNKGSRIYRYDIANGLVGLDLQTGRELWRLPEVCGSSRFQQGGQLWQHNGRSYILAASNSGTSLIDPQSGTIIAQAPGLVNRHWGLTVGADVIVGDLLSDPSDHRSPATPAGYRITPDGLTHLWTLGERYKVRPGGGVAIGDRLYLQSHGDFHGIVCVDAQTGDVLAEEPCDIGGGEHSPFMVASGNRLIAARDRTRGLILLDADPAKNARIVVYLNLTLATGYCGSVVPALSDGRWSFACLLRPSTIF